ncbi:hypothetical protein LTR36_007343 [Oleoguttula mirabilis]|uniref:PROP1-like PPR domain-containing protein n=1 Tax=Oleoguttula mirabilis TaxID=1507867 RepID=A0AAV9JA53_9PEZI|nr:hypothetical protein LTR36_007343 [Oleoguttula mirabilis]
MLERAKACLKSGARDSLRCAPTAPRSKRLLHSTFWKHGAGDLDLPLWAMSTCQMPPDLPLRHDDTRRRHVGGDVKEVKSRPSAPADGLFLDFLYPPQALAWMHKVAGRGPAWERWERRNARRLPEGFVQTSRGYTSRAYAQAARPKADAAQEQEQQQEHENSYGRESASKRLGLPNGEAEQLVMELGAAGQEKARQDGGMQARQDKLEAAYHSAAGDVFSAEFADSPGELAEASSDLMKRLRTIMAGRAGAGKTQELSDRVLTIYDSLDQASKDEMRLKVELLDWLSAFTNNDAEVRSTELYHSIPIDQRTLQVYQAALAVFMRRGRHVQAFNLHREALKNIANGDQVTRMFFKYAVEEHRWPLAMNIKAQYTLLVEQPNRAAGPGNMFWFHVSQLLELLPKALALAKYLRALDSAGTSNKQVRAFAASFFREALLQEFEASEPGKANTTTYPQGGLGLAKHSVGQLFAYLRESEDAAKLYERMLVSMTADTPRYSYPHIHRVVSYVYMELRKQSGTAYRIPESLFMRLLERLTRFWDIVEKSEKHHSNEVRYIIKDWKHDHGKLGMDGVTHLLSWHARSGRIDRFEVWYAYLQEHYPGYEVRKSVLWSTIYVHARRVDLPKAKEAFEEAVRATAAHDEVPPLVCWNVLLHAHSRADDLEGALDTLQGLIDTGEKPDEFSFHPVMEMLAKRGDVDGVKDLLTQYDTLALKRREAAFFGSLLTAFVNCGEIEQAEAALKVAIDEVKTAKVHGSLTGCFNIVLTAHALRRNVDATMRVYRWMKAEDIRMDADTFAALIQALTVYRQTHAAYKILREVMPEHGCRPTAFHYALVMTGYVNQGKYAEALEVHEHMRVRNIRITASSNIVYLKAKALQEHADTRSVDAGTADTARAGFHKVETQPLKDTIKELQKILRASNGADLAAKQPQTGLGVQESPNAVPAAYFNFLIYIHGRRRCFEAVQELFRKFKVEAHKLGDAENGAPIKLLAALMTAHLRAGDYDEVERCWQLAKEQADGIAATVPVPHFHVPGSAAAEALDGPEADIMELQPAVLDDAQEAGFRMTERSGDETEDTQPRSTGVKAQRKQALVTDTTVAPKAPKPSPRRQHILTRPLRFYLYALARQNRFPDILDVVSKIFRQGYTMDNRTWNTFVQLLCQCSPPLVLLAFTLTERFLTPHFPGWAPVGAAYLPHTSAKREGLQYIRARYLRPGQLMPQYQTLVILGSALLRLRSIEASGRRGGLKMDGAKGLERYVGGLRQIRKQAPKTLFVVQSMPTVDDHLQNRLLRRGS